VSGPRPSQWASLPLGPGVSLLTSDGNGLLAFAKPEGVLSHPNESRDQARSVLQARYSLEGEFYEWVGETGGQPLRIYLLNRLDSGTSGVILAASSEALAREMRAQFKRQCIQKIYYALVFGAPVPPVQVWRDRLAVRKKAGKVRTETAGNIPAEAKIRAIRIQPGNPPLSLIRLEPRTGRSHQLRVQCAERHLPIVGDATYGDFRLNREFAKASGNKRLFLHSSETHFDYTWAGRSWRFAAHAELPKAFTDALGGRSPRAPMK